MPCCVARRIEAHRQNDAVVAIGLFDAEMAQNVRPEAL